MRKLLLSITFLFTSFYAVNAQEVTFEDNNLKQMLLYENCVNKYSHSNETTFTDADTNNNGIIEQSELDDIRHFDFNAGFNQPLPWVDFNVNSEWSISPGYPWSLILEFPSFDSSHMYTESEISNLVKSGEIKISLNLPDYYRSFVNSFSDLNKLKKVKTIKLEASLSHPYLPNGQTNYLDFSDNDYLESLIVKPISLEHINLNLYNSQTDSYYPLVLIYPQDELFVVENPFKINQLDLDACSSLRYVDVSNNTLTGLDFIISTGIETLYCSNNNLNYLPTNYSFHLKNLDCSGNNISNLDLANSTKLEYLSCNGNQLTNLDVSNSTVLKGLECAGNQLTSLDVSKNTILEFLICNHNQLTNLDVSNSNKLEYLQCHENQLINLDLSNSYRLLSLIASNNRLEYINVKNGSDFEEGSLYGFISYNGNPNLKYICVSEENIDRIIRYNEFHNINAEVNTYCSFEPAGEKNTLTGKTAINCEEEQGHSIKLKKEDGTGTGYLFSDANGNYETYGGIGTYTLTPIFEHPYYTISPTSKEITFTDLGSTETVDFCITPIVDINDVEVKIIPIHRARPGFDTEYKIVYKNKGTTTLNGNVEFYFNDNLSDYIPNPAVTPFQENGKLTFDYTDLKPFESRTILVTLNINPPTETIETPVNGGDILTYNAVINPTTNDEAAQDNEFILTQTVVNSFDPNDKTCLQGTSITPDLIGEYVDYLIRFENTGSAEAINIVVKDIIDTSMFDVSTLIPTDSSHDYELRIDGNKVEFIFEGINLPFDDANNDGYVAFKIKTLPTVTLGDELKNKADIYFDFNFPIETNKYVTTVETLSSEEILRQAQNDITFFPNPASEKVTFNEEVQSVQIFNLSGQLLQTSIVNGTELNISELAKGNYILKITTKKGTAIEKLIKE
ncbi:MAG: T9SS type A sorting domain-containing protein [Flavobacteriales bacterium]|nr:T9SS type A sorting domain-containing protein [Flavobacteriales bacterium]